MLLAINMPAWLVDFWTIYGDMIMPLLVTAMSIILTSIFLRLKTKLRIESEKTDAQIVLMESLAKKEDNKKELDALKQENKEMRDSIAYLGEMFSTAFNSSGLEPDVKDKLESLANKVKYGTGLETIKQLESDKLKLVEEIEALTTKINTPVVSTMIEKTVDVVKKIRK